MQKKDFGCEEQAWAYIRKTTGIAAAPGTVGSTEERREREMFGLQEVLEIISMVSNRVRRFVAQSEREREISTRQ